MNLNVTINLKIKSEKGKPWLNFRTRGRRHKRLLKLLTGKSHWPTLYRPQAANSFSSWLKQTRKVGGSFGNSCLTSNHEQHLTWHFTLASHEWTDCSAWFPGLAICLSPVYATTSVFLVTLQVQILPPTTDALPGRLLRLCCCEWTRHFPPSVCDSQRSSVLLLAKGGAGCFFFTAAAVLLFLQFSFFFSPPTLPSNPFSCLSLSIHAAPILALSSHLWTGRDPGVWGWK